MTSDHGLGDIVSRHKVDNSRRATIAVTGLVVGVVFSAIAVPLVIAMLNDGGEGPRRGVFPGLVAGVAFVALWLAVANGIGYFLRQDEVFELRERGLVRRRATREVAVPWERIRAMRDDSRSYGHWFGWNVHVRIRVHGGPRLLITGLVRNADELVIAVQRAAQHRSASGRS